MLDSAQLLDAAHGVMHGPQLCFDLRKQVELMSDEDFCAVVTPLLS